MTATVVVTGGAGFIGSHLVDDLLKDGYRVRVLDNFSTGKRENLESASNNKLCEVVDGDIRDTVLCKQVVKGTETIFHQAALGSVARSVEDPKTTHEINATGTLNLLIAAKDAKVKRFVYASSSSVYGDTPTLPKIETMEPQPLSPYAVTKLMGELYCKVFFELYGLSTVSLRYFNVFGPRQDPHSAYAAVIPAFCQALKDGKPPIIYGDGEQARDFTYVANVVAANRRAAEAPRHACGRTFNVACGERVSLNKLLRQLSEAFGTVPTPIHKDARSGDVRDSLASVDAAKSALGYSPSVSFADGIGKTVSAFRNG